MMADHNTSEEKLTPPNIIARDPNEVHQLYESWPARAEEMLGREVDVPRKHYERVGYLAVGGSATAGDIITDWFVSSEQPEVTVFRGTLPNTRLDSCLLIVCSTSGDTSETLSMAEVARKRGAEMVTISHDGKLKEFAAREGLAHIEIPLAKAPRYSLPYSLFASIAVLRAASLLDGIEGEVRDAISTMKETAGSIGLQSPLSENPSKRLAARIGTKNFPAIYASSVTKSVARRFKNSLNENAKVHARFDSAPDIFHNEVEAWDGSGNARDQLPIFLRRSRDPPTEARSLDVFDDMLRSRGVVPLRLDASGRTNLGELMNLCYTLDFASYYVAILRGVEPFGIPLIDELKKRKANTA